MQSQRHKSSAKMGTRCAIAEGSNRLSVAFKDYRRKPRVRIPAASYTLTALSDPAKWLPPKTCIIIESGRVLTGTVVVWRYPAQAAQDVELWEAMPPPESMTCLPNNTVVCSALGHGISQMAGGDYDGDLVMVTFCEELVSIARETATSVNKFDYAGTLRGMNAALTGDQETQKSFKHQGRHKMREHVKRALRMPPPDLRGQMCATAERAAALAINSLSPLSDGTLSCATHSACVSHKAMDAPKKYTHRQIRELMKKTLKEHAARISGKNIRSTQMLGDELRPALTWVNISIRLWHAMRPNHSVFW